ncbi:uncharacterized protein LOC6738404 isoform X5 [Drosophila simulans]|uniref:Uncharacterized protein, isoform C n=1 Tax=Drosophila simulans TaxID=7240 RepID=A0A0J9RWT4_DROSI|nr:uncharacterized protein LOC6738404 isoform X5 [Drosophila simulans]KMZ00149.1 uncharacterized protein Dsimw501_GD12436, isoform C [Drosophila simulans]KMZ00151.1 uncharacterized protein Dsimw501_GD12436, isoform E [Drosophila simulans]
MRFLVLSTLLLASLALGQAQQPGGLAVDAYWRTTNIEAWPPGAPVAEKSGKLIAGSAPAQDLTPYGAYQPVLLSAPYYAAYNLPLAYVVQPTIASADQATKAGATTTTTTTGRPESLADDSSSELEKPEKLQALPAEKTRTTGDLKSDVGLRSAVSKINPEYVIEEIVPVPGKLVISTSGSPRSAKQQLKKATGPQKLRKQAGGRVPLKVEATGKTSTSSGNFPQIPFGNYFLPYRPEQAQAIQGRKQAALILEPHSKAVVGNGGTAISTPISKAYLKKGVPTNVYFNPESVAIAGVGGKAHATADLELDLFT